MVKKNRWGKKYKDKRDWSSYNKRLVNRGMFYINPVFLDTWLEETKAMNHGKVGQPYLYPKSMIEFLSVLHTKNFDYRGLEGIARGLSNRLGNFPIISFSQIRKRIIELKYSFSPKKNNLLVAVDGSGLKVSNRGDWIRKQWKIERGWIKVVIMGDEEGNIVDIRIGNENLDEKASGRGMVRKNHNNIDKFMGDGLHDCKDNFKLLDQLGIEPVIKIRKNASTKRKGCLARQKEVLTYKELGYKKWAKKKQYGKRWPASEGIFSGVKGIFGENIRSHKTRYMYHEAKAKFWAYQKIKDLGA